MTLIGLHKRSYKSCVPETTRGRIALYLLEEGQASAKQIATSLGLRPDSVGTRLLELKTDGMATKDVQRVAVKRGAPTAVWGLTRHGIQEALAYEFQLKNKGSK